MSGEDVERPEVVDLGSAGEPDPVTMDTFQENEKTSLCSVGKASETDLHNDDLPSTPQVEDRATTLSVDMAKQQIAPEILSALANRFNGKLSSVRPIDEKDLLLNRENTAANAASESAQPESEEAL